DAFGFHAAMAGRVLAIADRPDHPNDGPTDFERQSTIAVALLLVGDGSFTLGHQYLEKALVRFPDEVRLLLSLGTLNETAAGGDLSPARLDQANILGRARAAREERLREAEHMYDRALAVDPALVVPVVTLAHIHVLLRDDVEAEPVW